MKDGTPDERCKLASLARHCRRVGDSNDHTRKLIGFLLRHAPSKQEG